MCAPYQDSPTVAEGVSPNAARTPRAIVWLDVLELDVAVVALLGEASVEGLYATLTALDQAVAVALGTAPPRARRLCATAERQDPFQRRPVRFDVTLCFSDGNDAGRRIATGVEAVAAIWGDRWMP